MYEDTFRKIFAVFTTIAYFLISFGITFFVIHTIAEQGNSEVVKASTQVQTVADNAVISISQDGYLTPIERSKTEQAVLEVIPDGEITIDGTINKLPTGEKVFINIKWIRKNTFGQILETKSFFAEAVVT